MTALAYNVAEEAKLQVRQLSASERRALSLFFSSSQAAESKPVSDGRLVGRFGARRGVLWKRTAEGKPLVLSVVDVSYASQT